MGRDSVGYGKKYKSALKRNDFLGALQHAVIAGDQARDDNALDDALHWFEQALSVAENVADGKKKVEQVFLAHRNLTEVAALAEDATAVKKNFQQLLTFARTLNDVSRVQIALHVGAWSLLEVANGKQTLILQAKKSALESLDLIETSAVAIDRILKERGETDDDPSRRKAGICQLLADIFYELGENSTSELYCNKVLEFPRIAEDPLLHYCILLTKRRTVDRKDRLTYSKKLLEVNSRTVKNAEKEMRQAETLFILAMDYLVHENVAETKKLLWQVYKNYRKVITEDRQEQLDKALSTLYTVESRIKAANSANLRPQEKPRIFEKIADTFFEIDAVELGKFYQEKVKEMASQSLPCDDSEFHDELDDVPDDVLLKRMVQMMKFEDELEEYRRTRNKMNASGETRLHDAAKTDDLNLVKILVEKCDYNLDARDNGGWTPLSEAVSHKQVEIVQYLVSKGANVNTKSTVEICGSDGTILTGIGHTPLMEACDIGHAELIEILVRARANLLMQNSNGWIAVNYLERTVNNLDNHERNSDEGRKLADLLAWMKGAVAKEGMGNRVLKADIPSAPKSTPKPTKERAKISEDSSNLMMYQNVIGQFGRQPHSTHSRRDALLNPIEEDEQLDDPKFLERDDIDDAGENADEVMEIDDAAFRRTVRLRNSGAVLAEEMECDENVPETCAPASETLTPSRERRAAKRRLQTIESTSNVPVKRKSSDTTTLLARSSSPGSRASPFENDVRNSLSSSKLCKIPSVASDSLSRHSSNYSGFSNKSASFIFVDVRCIDSVTGLCFHKHERFEMNRAFPVKSVAESAFERMSSFDDEFKLVKLVVDGKELRDQDNHLTLEEIVNGRIMKVLAISMVFHDWQCSSPQALFERLKLGSLPRLAHVLRNPDVDLGQFHFVSMKCLSTLIQALCILLTPRSGATTVQKLATNGCSLWPPTTPTPDPLIAAQKERAVGESLALLFAALRSLDLSSQAIPNSVLEVMASTKVQNSSLTELSLAGGEFELATIDRFLKSHPNLASINLNDVVWSSPVNDLDVETFIWTLSDLPSLESLSLDRVDGISRERLSVLLQKRPKLRISQETFPDDDPSSPTVLKSP